MLLGWGRLLWGHPVNVGHKWSPFSELVTNRVHNKMVYVCGMLEGVQANSLDLIKPSFDVREDYGILRSER